MKALDLINEYFILKGYKYEPKTSIISYNIKHTITMLIFKYQLKQSIHRILIVYLDKTNLIEIVSWNQTS